MAQRPRVGLILTGGYAAWIRLSMLGYELRQTGLNGENLAQAIPTTVPSATVLPIRPRAPRNAEANNA